ncbi:MAG: choice-of-anchor J domain-containing protein [Bacteroidetes bacterium]|nr:choice-of-anchor J domain-containing protein [Bacteroidota bacterium]
MKISLKSLFAVIVLGAMVVVSSCRKDEFDSPPSGGQDPNIVVNMTIKQLKDLYRDTIINNDAIVKITKDWNISGTVVADDKSGNFYKTIVIDDGTAGISIRIDRSEFWREFPIGRRIFVRLQNLVIGDYADLIQLGGYIDLTDPTQPEVAPIPFTLIDSYVVPGVSSLPVIPIEVTIDDLLSDFDGFQNRLVKLSDVEFKDNDTSKTYADAVSQLSGEVFLQDCNTSDEIMVRSSGYATFASKPIPNNNGSLVAVLTVFTTTAQLVIRDTYDVVMNQVRCDGGPPPPGNGINETFSSQTTNTDINLAGWYNISAQGNRFWRAGVFSGDTYAQATAFGSGLPAMESWLITPAFDLATVDTLSFRSSWGFFVHNGLTVWIATNFTGANVATANWTQLTCTLAVQADGQYTWVTSGNVPLTSFTGTAAHVGFKYLGDGTTNTTSWRIDDVVIH